MNKFLMSPPRLYFITMKPVFNTQQVFEKKKKKCFQT